MYVVSCPPFDASHPISASESLRSSPFSISATVPVEALSALRRLTAKSSLTVWSCDHSEKSDKSESEDCPVRRKGFAWSMSYASWAKKRTWSCPAKALEAPLEVLIPKGSALVRHLEPNASLVEAIDLILEGAHNIVIPIQESQDHSNKEKCFSTITPSTPSTTTVNTAGSPKKTSSATSSTP
ncbi:hypothetical protein L3X38_021282 [Prunus dulcis]|uniref:Uncharacterized protein n=1 Tax=Prunus dulcis TaxID=3755 RepID=A0AAD4VW93_PRUDU|nr:hypothetical protein L3X38_021282 [Prunus dulcis]